MDVCPNCSHNGALVPVGAIRPGLAKILQRDRPEAKAFCAACIARARVRRLAEAVAEDHTEADKLEREIEASIHEQERVAESIVAPPTRDLTFGERLADRVAEFGGSWRFILLFGGVIVVWMAYNGIVGHGFDPYPFILLNLVLSCLAAVQAPVIMMSQNRQEERDRLRAESDYRTNLRAEFEVRMLHEKLDFLLTRQMNRLLEIQEMQVDLLEEASGRGARPGP